MKYCISYDKDTSKHQYVYQADEWNIMYNPNDDTLIEFLEKFSDRRINLYVGTHWAASKAEDLKFMQELCEKFPNLYIVFYDVKKDEDEILSNANIRYFVTNPVNNWDKLYVLLHTSVTDIYVAEALAFEMDKVAALVHQAGKKVRVYPNVAQAEAEDIPAHKKFFIRPEDIEYYEPLVDTFDILAESDVQIVTLKVYKEDKQWFGPLKEIIINFNEDVDNKYIIPRFGEARTRCGKKCFKGESCNICDRILDLGNTLEKAHIAVQIDKK